MKRNTSNYIKNVGKSGAKIVDNVIRPQMPTIRDTYTNSIETIGEFRRIVMTGRNNVRIGERIQSRIFRPVKEVIENMKSDLKSGKLYNDDREMGNLSGMSDLMDTMFDDEPSENIVESESKLDNDAFNKVLKSTTAASMAAERSGNFIAQNSTKNTEYISNFYSQLNTQHMMIITKHHMEMMKGLNNLQNIGMSIVDFNIKTATDFFNKSLDNQNLQLNELRDIKNAINDQLEITKKIKINDNAKRGMKISNKESIFNPNGSINLSGFIQNAQNNIKNMIPVDADQIKLIIDNFKNNPIGTILENLMSSAIPKNVKKKMNKFDDSFGGVFANLMSTINKWRDNPTDKYWKKMVGNIFGVNKDSINPNLALYKNQELDADLEIKKAKAITEVIPSYLSEILKSISGTDKSFDYSIGKFVDNEYIRERIIKDRNNMAEASAYRSIGMVRNKVIPFVDHLNSDDKDIFIDDMQTFHRWYMVTDLFGKNKISYIEALKDGLDNLQGGEKAFNLLFQLYKSIPNSVINKDRNEYTINMVQQVHLNTMDNILSGNIAAVNGLSDDYTLDKLRMRKKPNAKVNKPNYKLRNMSDDEIQEIIKNYKISEDIKLMSSEEEAEKKKKEESEFKMPKKLAEFLNSIKSKKDSMIKKYENNKYVTKLKNKINDASNYAIDIVDEMNDPEYFENIVERVQTKFHDKFSNKNNNIQNKKVNIKKYNTKNVSSSQINNAISNIKAASGREINTPTGEVKINTPVDNINDKENFENVVGKVQTNFSDRFKSIKNKTKNIVDQYKNNNIQNKKVNIKKYNTKNVSSSQINNAIANIKAASGREINTPSNKSSNKNNESSDSDSDGEGNSSGGVDLYKIAKKYLPKAAIGGAAGLLISKLFKNTPLIGSIAAAGLTIMFQSSKVKSLLFGDPNKKDDKGLFGDIKDKFDAAITEPLKKVTEPFTKAINEKIINPMGKWLNKKSENVANWLSNKLGVEIDTKKDKEQEFRDKILEKTDEIIDATKGNTEKASEEASSISETIENAFNPDSSSNNKNNKFTNLFDKVINEIKNGGTIGLSAGKGALISSMLGLTPIPGAIFGAIFGKKKVKKKQIRKDEQDSKKLDEQLETIENNNKSYKKISIIMSSGISSLLGLGPIPGALFASIINNRRKKKAKIKQEKEEIKDIEEGLEDQEKPKGGFFTKLKMETFGAAASSLLGLGPIPGFLIGRIISKNKIKNRKKDQQEIKDIEEGLEDQKNGGEKKGKIRNFFGKRKNEILGAAASSLLGLGPIPGFLVARIYNKNKYKSTKKENEKNEPIEVIDSLSSSEGISGKIKNIGNSMKKNISNYNLSKKEKDNKAHLAKNEQSLGKSMVKNTIDGKYKDNQDDVKNLMNSADTEEELKMIERQTNIAANISKISGSFGDNNTEGVKKSGGLFDWLKNAISKNGLLSILKLALPAIGLLISKGITKIIKEMKNNGAGGLGTENDNGDSNFSNWTDIGLNVGNIAKLGFAKNIALKSLGLKNDKVVSNGMNQAIIGTLGINNGIEHIQQGNAYKDRYDNENSFNEKALGASRIAFGVNTAWNGAIKAAPKVLEGAQKTIKQSVIAANKYIAKNPESLLSKLSKKLTKLCSSVLKNERIASILAKSGFKDINLNNATLSKIIQKLFQKAGKKIGSKTLLRIADAIPVIGLGLMIVRYVSAFIRGYNNVRSDLQVSKDFPNNGKSLFLLKIINGLFYLLDEFCLGILSGLGLSTLFMNICLEILPFNDQFKTEVKESQEKAKIDYEEFIQENDLNREGYTYEMYQKGINPGFFGKIKRFFGYDNQEAYKLGGKKNAKLNKKYGGYTPIINPQIPNNYNNEESSDNYLDNYKNAVEKAVQNITDNSITNNDQSQQTYIIMNGTSASGARGNSVVNAVSDITKKLSNKGASNAKIINLRSGRKVLDNLGKRNPLNRKRNEYVNNIFKSMGMLTDASGARGVLSSINTNYGRAYGGPDPSDIPVSVTKKLNYKHASGARGVLSSINTNYGRAYGGPDPSDIPVSVTKKLNYKHASGGRGSLTISDNLTTVNYTKGRTSAIKYIVMHYTANNGDTAYGNTNYFKSKNRSASAHYFVDKTSIWRCVKDEDTAWHCGTKGTYYHECRNASSIGIEMCSVKKNGVYYIPEETQNNAAALVKSLMAKYNIPIDNVIRHYDVTHKMCPEPFVRDPSQWNAFKQKVSGSSGSISDKGSQSSSSSSSSKPSGSNNSSSNDSNYSNDVIGDGSIIIDDGGNIGPDPEKILGMANTLKTYTRKPGIKLLSKNPRNIINYAKEQLSERMYTNRNKIEEVKNNEVTHYDSDSNKVSFFDKVKNKVKDTASNLIDKVKSGFSKVKSGIANVIGKAKSGAANMVSKAKFGINSIKNWLFGGSGARGTEDNDYYNQADPRWGNMYFGKYNGHRDTVADGGCGPTVAAMALQKLTGQKVTPDNMARLAMSSGMKYDNGGTDPNFFDIAGKKYGIRFNENIGIDYNTIRSLKSGNPVIFMGKDMTGTSPFGSGSHYVLGTGFDNNGNVNILDPQNPKNNHKYNIKDIAMSSTNVMTPTGRGKCSFGNKCYGRGGNPVGEALVAKIASLEGTLSYTQGPQRTNIEGGYSDCSSLIQWVYKKVCGIDPGSTTTSQKTKGRQIVAPTKDVDKIIANAQAGDVLLFSGHAEMYDGNGCCWGNGNKNKKGPNKRTVAQVVKSLGKCQVRRYIDGSEKILDTSVNVSSSSDSPTIIDESSVESIANSISSPPQDTALVSGGNKLSKLISQTSSLFSSKLLDDAGNVFTNNKLDSILNKISAIWSGNTYNDTSDITPQNISTGGVITSIVDKDTNSNSSNNDESSNNEVSLNKTASDNSTDAKNRKITDWTSSRVTADLLNKFIASKNSSGVIKGKGQLFINAGNKNGIDPRVLLAICAHETGWGTSKLIKNQNNPGGLKANGKFLSYPTLADGINAMAERLANKNSKYYIAAGNDTLAKIQPHYCPNSGGGKEWISNISSLYQQLINLSGGAGARGSSIIKPSIRPKIPNNLKPGRGMSIINPSIPDRLENNSSIMNTSSVNLVKSALINKESMTNKINNSISENIKQPINTSSKQIIGDIDTKAIIDALTTIVGLLTNIDKTNTDISKKEFGGKNTIVAPTNNQNIIPQGTNNSKQNLISAIVSGI